MIWADNITLRLKGKTQHIDDMFTPSGYAHVGSLRGPILHDIVYRAMSEKDKSTIFTYIFNDFDPIDGLPAELTAGFSKYLGFPLRLAPSPDKEHKSFADYFAADFKNVLTSLGVKAQYLSSWDMYRAGKFNQVIKTALDNRTKILEVYKNVAGYKKKSSDWYPLQVICPRCSKLGTTKVTDWDGELVIFKCEENLVTWTKGCGYTGKISPFNGIGKLPWKVDWPAHWKVLGVTFEGAGKDHASRGGSYDIAFELCKEVFKYPKPYYFPYEFFLFGGKKMSSSKGIGLKARDLTGVLPPNLARFLVVRIPPQKTLEFDPTGMAIPNLFDEYDRCMEAYFFKLENKLPEGKPGEVLTEFSRIIELSEVKPLPKKRIMLTRFRTIVNLLKNNTDPIKFYEEQKKEELNKEERELLKERITYAKIYLKKYVGEKESVNSQQTKVSFSDEQNKFLQLLAEYLKSAKKDPEQIQRIVFDTVKKSGLSPKDAFRVFYQKLTGNNFGPKAADLILQIGLEKVLKLLAI